MECAEIKERLSEYIDGVLDVKTKALIEEHLLTCKGCSEELASLKAYIKEVGGLKKIEAPEDFLEKVHERLRRRFEFGEIVRILFIPVQIKVPLEAALVAGMVILGVYLSSIRHPFKQVAYKPEIADTKMAGSKPGEEIVVSALKEKKPESLVISKEPAASIPTEAAPILTEEEKPIELALLIKPEPPATTYGVTKAAKTKYDLNANVMAMKSLPEETEKASVGEDKQVLLMPKKEVDMVKDKKERVVLSPYLNETISKIKNIVELVDGKVISVEETIMPLYITAEIPAKDYSVFLEKLSALGELQKPLPSVTAKDEEPVRLQIKFISSSLYYYPK